MAEFLQAVNNIIQGDLQEKRDTRQTAMQLLGFKIRKDEADTNRLFQETQQVNQDIKQAERELRSNKLEYAKVAGIFDTVKDPSAGFRKLQGKFKSFNADNLEESQKNLTLKKDYLESIGKQRDSIIGNISNASQAYTTLAMQSFDEARQLDKKGDSNFVEGTESNLMFDKIEAGLSKAVGRKVKLDRAQRNEMIRRWHELGKERDTREFNRARERRLNTPDVSTNAPSLDDLRQSITDMNDRLTDDLIESGFSKVPKFDAKSTSIKGTYKALKNQLTEVLLKSTVVGQSFDNVPDGLSEDELQAFEDVKTTKGKREQSKKFIKYLVNEKLNFDDFDFQSGEDRDNVQAMIDRVDLLKKIKNMDIQLSSYYGTQSLQDSDYSNARVK